MADGDRNEQLFEELRALARRDDNVPAEVVHAAKGAFAWRTIEADLAELAYDSLLETEAVLVRSDGGSRFLTFEGAGAAVELEVVTAGERRHVLGQLVPGERAHVEIRHGGGVVEVEADDLGRFRSEAVEPGPMSLRCRVERADRPVVETDWVTI